MNPNQSEASFQPESIGARIDPNRVFDPNQSGAFRSLIYSV